MKSNSGNKYFKAALFQVASSVGFLSRFSRKIPSMLNKEVNTGRDRSGMCPTVIFIYLLVIIILKDSENCIS